MNSEEKSTSLQKSVNWTKELDIALQNYIKSDGDMTSTTFADDMTSIFFESESLKTNAESHKSNIDWHKSNTMADVSMFPNTKDIIIKDFVKDHLNIPLKSPDNRYFENFRFNSEPVEEKEKEIMFSTTAIDSKTLSQTLITNQDNTLLTVRRMPKLYSKLENNEEGQEMNIRIPRMPKISSLNLSRDSGNTQLSENTLIADWISDNPNLFGSQPIFCQDVPHNTEQREVFIQVIVTRLYDIDHFKETFSVEVTISARWREPHLDAQSSKSKKRHLGLYWNPRISIDNVIKQSCTHYNLTKELNVYGNTFLVEKKKIRATLSCSNDLTHFPYETHKLSMYIMSDTTWPLIGKLMNEPFDQHMFFGSDKGRYFRIYKMVEIEMLNENMNENLSEEEVRYQLMGDCRTRMKLSLHIARSPMFYVCNIFIFNILNCIQATSVFVLDARSLLFQRAITNVYFLFLQILFKTVADRHSPSIRYTTINDTYFMISCFYLVLITVYNLAMMTLQEANIDNRILRVKNVDSVASIAFILFLCCYNAYFIRGILYVPYMKRRELRKQETEYLKKLSII